MAKHTKRTITYPIEQKIKDLHKAIVNGDKETADRLQRDVDFVYWGIV